MIKLKDYIEKERHLRARAEYSGRNSQNGIYLQGVMSLQQALTAFQTFGKVKLMQEYIDGRRVTLWTGKGKWSKLEGSLK